MAFQTAIQRAQGTGPTRQVRPMLPTSYDATGGRNKWGAPRNSEAKYLENNRRMYTMEDVPQASRTGGWQAPSQSDAVNIARQFGGGSQAQNTAMYAQRGVWGAPDKIAPDVAGFLSRNAAPSPEATAPMAQPENAWQRGQLAAPAAGEYSALTSKPKAGERWGTALDKPGEIRNALGPRALARRARRMDGYGGGRSQGYGGYE